MSEGESQPTERKLTPAVWLATGFGVGLVAPAPGTVGALWGLPWAWLLLSTGNPWWWLTVPAGILLGIPLCTRAARDLGGKKDPGAIVWDEIATVPLVFIPVAFSLHMWRTIPGAQPHQGLWQEAVQWLSWNPGVLLLIGFGLHRLFDISKPPPCRQIERLPEGWGIMLDDVVAGIYGMLTMAPILFAYVYWSAQGVELR